jgi:hypothetical protein
MILVIKFNEKIVPTQLLSKKLRKNKEQYIDFFHNHTGDWFSSEELRYIFDLKSDRTVRQLINYLRVEKELPIIASKEGYKMTFDSQELKEYYEQIQYRACTILAAAKAIKNNI